MENAINYLSYELLSMNYSCHSGQDGSGASSYEYSVTPISETTVRETTDEETNEVARTLHVVFHSSLKAESKDGNETPRFQFEAEVGLAFSIDSEVKDIQKFLNDSAKELMQKGVEISHSVLMSTLKQTRYSGIDIPIPMPLQPNT